MSKVMIVAGFGRSLLLFRGELIQSWLKAGHEVVALAPSSSVRHKLENWGARYIELPVQRATINPLKDIVLALTLVYYIRREKPDRVFLYTVKPVIYASLAAYFLPSVSVYSMITGLGKVFTGRAKWFGVLQRLVIFLYRAALKRNRVVFFQNPDDESYFLNLKLVRDYQVVRVNGSGVNLAHYSVMPLPVGEVRFLLIARLLREKGILEYIEAARILKNRYHTVSFSMIVWDLGDGHKDLGSSEIEAWKHEGVVTIYDETNDVRPYLAQAGVFVLPSYYREGVPRTILEAMAMGRAVITTDVPGCRETVDNGVSGFLVPARDIKALSEVMERFIREPDLVGTMGTESRKRAEEKFDVHKVNVIINKAMGLE